MELAHFNQDQTNNIIEFDKETISRIILEFLGNKETLNYSKKGQSFLLRHNDLAQFHYLLDQKLANQKDILTLHLNVDFHFSDGTIRSINDISSFEKINEINNVNTDRVTLTWKIINKFHGHKNIETQVIELSFIVASEEIILNITHTNQSWALEIFELLRKKIIEITQKDSLLIHFYKSIVKMDISNFIITYFFAVILAFFTLSKLSAPPIDTNKLDPIQTIFNNYKATESKEDLLISLSILDKYENEQALYLLEKNKILDPKSQENLIKTLDADINKDSTFKKIANWSIFLFIFFILIPSILIIYPNYALKKLRKPSYIIINNYMESMYEKKIDSMKGFGFYGATAFSLSVFTGVVGCIIYDFVK
jgi:hypothetical protein